MAKEHSHALETNAAKIVRSGTQEKNERAIQNGKDLIFEELKLSMILIIIALTIGTLAYHFIEKWELIDALYFSSATLTTIGYGDISPKTVLGKLFTIVYMWSGISVALFFIYSLMKYRRHMIDKQVGRVVESLGMRNSKKKQ